MRFIVQCVEERMEWVAEMQEQIPHLEICMDKHKDAYETFMRSLEMGAGEPVVHLEDDAVLCSNFVAKIQAAIDLHPGSLIQFFSMRKDDLTIGSRWQSGASFMMNQCTYSPKGFDNSLLAFARVWPRLKEHPSGYDTMMADFLKVYKARYWNHVPNLVNHRVAKSIIDPRRSSKRQSLTFHLA